MKRSLPFLGLLLIFSSCLKREDKPTVPILFTGEVTEINLDGAMFSGSFKNLDPTKLVEFGFIWGANKDIALQVTINIKQPKTMKYTLSLKSGKENYNYLNQASLKVNTTYYMRTFVRYKEKTYYGNIVSFYSLGSRSPVLQNVVPSSGTFGDTIAITGKYIGYDINNTKVFFNEQTARILNMNDTAAWVIVPIFGSFNSYYNTGKINIILEKYVTRKSSLDNAFTLSAPKIESYTPAEGLAYNPILVTGSGFNSSQTKLMIGNEPCYVVNVNAQHIHALLPPVFTDYEGNLKIIVGVDTAVSGKVKIYAPKLTSSYPDSIFSYDSLYLTGDHLLNDSVKIFINNILARKLVATDKSMAVSVPGGICASRLTLDMRLGSVGKTFKSDIVFKQPENFKITANANNYFDGNFSIYADYLPELPANSNGPSVLINGEKNSSSYYSFTRYSQSSIFVNVDYSVMPVNGWLNTTVSFCPSTQFTLDSVFAVPSPQILNIPDTMHEFTSYQIQGRNFNPKGVLNHVILGNSLDTAEAAQSPQLINFSAIPVNFPEGSYSLKIVTNGQESNTVNVNIVHRWIKLTNLPERMGNGPIAFFTGDKFFVGGGQSNNKNFYAYDLNSGVWQKKSNLPLNLGLSVNDTNFGYLINGDYMYRYNISSDTWDTISSMPKSFSDYSTGFIYQNKIFVFDDEIINDHYYYDIASDTWNSYPGFSGGNENLDLPQGSVLAGDKAYIFDWEDKYELDLSTLKFISSYHTLDYFDEGYVSLNSFEYKGEAYFYDFQNFLIFNLSNFNTKAIKGPDFGSHDHIFRVNNIAYMVDQTSIWKFNLDMQ